MQTSDGAFYRRLFSNVSSSAKPHGKETVMLERPISFLKKYNIVICTIAAGLSTCTSGVTYAYNGVQSIIEPFINQSYITHYGNPLSTSGLNLIWGAMAAMTPIGAVVGSAMMNILAENFGRKNTGLVINSGITIFGAIISGLAKPLNCFELLFLGRFLLGICQGLGRIVPIYMAECALDTHRGFIGALSTFCWFFWDPIALLLAQTWVLGTQSSWQFLVSYCAFPATVAVLFVSRFLHESPKYLYIARKDEFAAVNSLTFYHGVHVDTKTLLAEYSREHQQALEQNGQPTADFGTIWTSRHLRISFTVCIMTIISVTIVGESLASQYSTRIFEMAGLGHDLAVLSSLISVLPGLVAMFLAATFIEKLGRRPLILMAMIFGVVANCLLTATADTRPGLAVAGIIMIKMAHDGGAAPVGHFIAGDICPQAIRAVSASVGWTMHHSIEVLVVLTFPILQSSIGSYTFSIFAVLSFIFLIWLFLYLPETKQRSVDDVVAEWILLYPEENR